jgi:chromosome segregation ATPase
MKKKTEKKNKNFEFGQVMSLLESMDGGIKVISEQHGDIMSKLKEHDQEFETIGNKLKEHDQEFKTIGNKLKKHDQEFETIGNKLKKHDQEFETIGNKLKEHDQRFGTLEEKMDLMQEDITEIKHKLSEKVDREEFNKLEKRMVKLEKLVFARA